MCHERATNMARVEVGGRVGGDAPHTVIKATVTMRQGGNLLVNRRGRFGWFVRVATIYLRPAWPIWPILRVAGVFASPHAGRSPQWGTPSPPWGPRHATTGVHR